MLRPKRGIRSLPVATATFGMFFPFEESHFRSENGQSNQRFVASKGKTLRFSAFESLVTGSTEKSNNWPTCCVQCPCPGAIDWALPAGPKQKTAPERGCSREPLGSELERGRARTGSSSFPPQVNLNHRAIPNRPARLLFDDCLCRRDGKKA